MSSYALKVNDDLQTDKIEDNLDYTTTSLVHSFL